MKIKSLTLTAMFTALTAALAQISVPIGPVPINFAHLGIFVGAALLGPKLAVLSILIYLLLGAMGAPVFSGFNGGLGALFGPTGGFLFGYLLCSLLTALLARKNLVLAMILGLFVNYLTGIPWLMHVTGLDFGRALAVGVTPFLFGDGVKIAISALISKRLRQHFTFHT